MLDTDSVSFALRGEGDVARRVAAQRPSSLCVSSVTLAELRYGAERRRSRKLHRLVDSFAGGVQIISFDARAATAFGVAAATLARRGAPIGDFDTLIAAHALALRVTLVTRNISHFSRIEGLKLDNWFGA